MEVVSRTYSFVQECIGGRKSALDQKPIRLLLERVAGRSAQWETEDSGGIAPWSPPSKEEPDDGCRQRIERWSGGSRCRGGGGGFLGVVPAVPPPAAGHVDQGVRRRRRCRRDLVLEPVPGRPLRHPDH